MNNEYDGIDEGAMGDDWPSVISHGGVTGP